LKIWIDADACPGPIRDIILKAAKRLAIETIFVANKVLKLPDLANVITVLVKQGPDVVDAYIVENAQANDLVVTQDILLAAQLVPRAITVITPRGTLYTADNINESLATRNLMQELRDTGSITSRTGPFDDKVKRLFARHFDAELHKRQSL
jgi:uncharacterized protein YaiI (UPF0178 family)